MTTEINFIPEPPSLQAVYDAQRAYTLSGQAATEGSPAIAIGRTAGLAQLLGQTADAIHFWDQLPKLANMPDIAAFHRAYEAHPEALAAFDSATDFPAGGTAFSNAAGSYAYALDYLSRGETALAGGHARDICHWGSKALRALGFVAQAEIVEKAAVEKTPAALPVHAKAASATRLQADGKSRA